jgi:hypothetical protein
VTSSRLLSLKGNLRVIARHAKSVFIVVDLDDHRES